MGFSDSSLFLKIALGLGIAAFLFDLIGLASPYWLVRGDFSSMLFKGCYRGTCSDIKDAPSKVEAAQAMNIMGFLAGVAGVVLMLVYMFMGNKMMRIIALIACFVAAGLILVGVIIVGDNKAFYDIGWAMVMAIIGALIYIGAGVLLVVDIMKK